MHWNVVLSTLPMTRAHRDEYQYFNKKSPKRIGLYIIKYLRFGFQLAFLFLSLGLFLVPADKTMLVATASTSLRIITDGTLDGDT